MDEGERLTIGCLLRYLIVFSDEHYILIVSSGLMAPLYVYSRYVMLEAFCFHGPFVRLNRPVLMCHCN